MTIRKLKVRIKEHKNDPRFNRSTTIDWSNFDQIWGNIGPHVQNFDPCDGTLANYLHAYL